MNSLFKKIHPFYYPLLGFLALAPFSSWIDLGITRYFYGIGNDPVEHFVSNSFVEFMFNWGPMPANIVGITAVFLLIGSYLVKKWSFLKNPCLVLVLTYALGTGLITNGILKEYWGRPRPKQVEEFGGTQAFRPFYVPNLHPSQPSKSFPCGHCTMGFFFFCFFFIGKRVQKPWLEYTGLVVALALGILLSLTRMAQGGHFLTDTLAAALLMWYTALAVDHLVYLRDEAS